MEVSNGSIVVGSTVICAEWNKKKVAITQGNCANHFVVRVGKGEINFFLYNQQSDSFVFCTVITRLKGSQMNVKSFTLDPRFERQVGEIDLDFSEDFSYGRVNMFINAQRLVIELISE